MILAVDVDVQLAGHELFGLVRRQRRLSDDGARHRAALHAAPDLDPGIAAGGRGPMEMRHGNVARDAAVADRPGEHLRRRVIGEIGAAGSAGGDRWHLLGAGELNGERDGCRLDLAEACRPSQAQQSRQGER